jgi:acyl-CoA reductase-like NAD-dependent aldehyde dehydrogenase
MKEVSDEYISGMLENQKRFFASGKTRNIRFRIDNLKKFKSNIVRYEKKITDALWVDLHNPYEEAWLTEISIVLLEIDNHISHLNRWIKARRVSTPLFNLPSSGNLCFPRIF